MNGRNCPNCGAPFDVGSDKCPYCGTLYYDLTAIDFTRNAPIFLKLKIDGAEITQKCLPFCDGIDFEYETVSVASDMCVIARPTVGVSMTTNIRFVALPDSDDRLCVCKVMQ